MTSDMHQAARANDVRTMKSLKRQGHDIKAKNINGYAPMHYAAQFNALDAMKWLKKRGRRYIGIYFT